jgi:hypothetical protein
MPMRGTDQLPINPIRGHPHTAPPVTSSRGRSARGRATASATTSLHPTGGTSRAPARAVVMPGALVATRPPHAPHGRMAPPHAGSRSKDPRQARGRDCADSSCADGVGSAPTSLSNGKRHSISRSSPTIRHQALPLMANVELRRCSESPRKPFQSMVLRA